MKWFNEGNRYFRESQYDQAIECWEKALEIGREEKNDQVISKCLMNIGTALSVQENWNKAIQYYHQSLEIERKKPDSDSFAECLINIGDAFFALKKWESAREYYEQSLEIYVERDRTKADVLMKMGLALFFEGKWKESIQFYQRSLELFKELKDFDGISKCLANLGVAHRNIGRWEEALKYYKQSLEIDEKLGDKKGSATCLMNMGIALEVLGKVKEAIENYQRSLVVFRELKDDNGIASCLLNLGNAFELLKKWEKALEFYEKSRDLFEKLGDKSGVSKSLTNIGIALRNLGRLEDAIKNYHESLKWFESINDQAATSKCLLDLGVAYYSNGKWDEALKYYQQSRELLQQLGDRPGEALICQNLGYGYQEQGDMKLALKFFTEALGIYTTLITQIDSDEYRETYAKEFEELPKIIDNLSLILEERSAEITQMVPEEAEVEAPEIMNELLAKLRDNVTELNASVKGQKSIPDISKNISGLMALVEKTLTTFSVTEKVKSEKISKNISNSIEMCNAFFKVYDSSTRNTPTQEILTVLEEIHSKLKTNFPELELIANLQGKIQQIKEEFDLNENMVEPLALDLKYVILPWIKRLLSIATTNRKLYLENIGKFSAQTSQKLRSEMNAISQRINTEGYSYSNQILSYIIVIKKGPGIPIYRMNFSGATFDPDLVGGFLSAIQSFGVEISQERTTMEKLAYKNFKIIFQDGKHVRCALILKGEITELLSQKLKNFVLDFETEFEKALIQRTGDVTPFSEADSLIKKHFTFE